MVEDIHPIVCRKWAVPILQYLAEEGPRNYSRIEDTFDTSSDVITDRLRELSDAGVIKRDKKSPKNVRYSITEDGEQLLSLVAEINQVLE
jgi:DNA-binding HxlR family transcriptional regulator